MNPDYQAFLKTRDERQLRALLEDVAVRIGTAAERPDDVERSRAIAHQINNLLAGARLYAELGLSPPRPTDAD